VSSVILIDGFYPLDFYIFFFFFPFFCLIAAGENAIKKQYTFFFWCLLNNFFWVSLVSLLLILMILNENKNWKAINIYFSVTIEKKNMEEKMSPQRNDI
jgi:hypothetical protein